MSMFVCELTRGAHTSQIKMPRILTLLAEEAHPGEDEVKSEAQFQRLVASCSDLPFPPRTPRAASDRGRYPEEVPNEEPTRENTPSDDDDEADTIPFAYGASEPIAITKPVTPAHSVNGDEFLFSESPGGAAMDVDLVSSAGSHACRIYAYRNNAVAVLCLWIPELELLEVHATPNIQRCPE